MKFEIGDIRTFTAAEYDAACAEMDATKRARLEKTRQKRDRLRTVLADALARRMLAEVLGCRTAEVEFSYTETGKPYLKNGGLHFSISHSEDLVAVAIADKPIGVDIEKIRTVIPRTAKKYFCGDERLYLFGHEPRDVDYDSVPTPDVLVRFFEIWTAKEAYLKADGEGLSGLRHVNSRSFPVKRHLLAEDYLLTVYIKE